MTNGNDTMTDWTARRPDDAAAEPETAETSASTEEAKIAALVEALSRESAENKDKLLRTLAEMENLRRRTDREVAEWADRLLTSRIRGIGSRRSSPTPLPMLFSHFFHQFGRWFPKSRKVLDSRVRSDAAEMPHLPGST